jgi:threonine dehydratase
VSEASLVTIGRIEEAAERVAPYVHETPVLRSASLDRELRCSLLLKAEHLQRTGAFKARGAHNAIMQLAADEAARGVATHSSGNHGAAVALAARNRGIAAHVVMPAAASRVKHAAVAAYGARIVPCEPSLGAREQKLREVVEETGAHAVHPYADARVICGQGTVGLEIARQCADAPPDVVVAPVGGGGLISGLAVALAARTPECTLIGAEPEGADDAHRSLQQGVRLPQPSPETIADGLHAGIGEPNFAIMRRHIREIVTMPDRRIVEAMRLLLTRTKQLVEPSGAVGLAAVLQRPERFAGRRVAIVLSGGNVDLDALPWTTPG